MTAPRLRSPRDVEWGADEDQPAVKEDDGAQNRPRPPTYPDSATHGASPDLLDPTGHGGVPKAVAMEIDHGYDRAVFHLDLSQVMQLGLPVRVLG